MLFVWTRQDPWSEHLANNCVVDRERLALRSICADNKQVRELLANGVPKVENVPALLVVEKTKDNQKTNVVYGQEAIGVLLTPLGIETSL